MMFKIVLFIFFTFVVNVAAMNNELENNTTNGNSFNKSTVKLVGPWSEVLEDWIISLDKNISARDSHVMKFADMPIKTNKVSCLNKCDISETDLYLLGGIEKLVYRVDFIETRLKRTEELLYSFISGVNDSKDVCSVNYTQVGQFCYYFSSLEYDWKSSANACRTMGGNLIEFETDEKKEGLIEFFQKNEKIKHNNYWIGGLNPGLLWIWAGSARPVHYSTTHNIHSNGRCLKLEYNTASKIYSYNGEDCGTRHKCICESNKNNEPIDVIDAMARNFLIKKDKERKRD